MLNKPEINEFYRSRLKAFGPSAKGMGWKDADAQQVRFRQLLKIIDDTEQRFSINDLGCGAGELINMLDEKWKGKYHYHGYDGLREMIEKAEETFRVGNRRSFRLISGYEEMEKADFTVTSGIFNVRNSIPDKDWKAFMLETLAAMAAVSLRGFAFNALTTYSDPAFRREELYYSDPLFLFDHCKKNFSRNVALLHDYGNFDFTILVKKEV